MTPVSTVQMKRVIAPRQRPPAIVQYEHRRRQRLAEHLRRAEPAVHGAAGSEREEIRALLGWDDASLDAFVNADTVIHTSPHASMNAFEPMFAFPWVAAELATRFEARPRAVHLRTSVTHNNLGDLRWRPYAWWHRGRDGSLVKTTLFSRNAKLRRAVLLAKPVPRIDPTACTPIDRAAIALARHARNYAYFCLIYRSFVERCAGRPADPPTVEVPIDILNAFSFQEDGVESWGATLARFGMPLRTIDEAGRLVELARPSPRELAGARTRLLLCPNAINLLQAQLLGLSTMIGAERMSAYVPQLSDPMARFAEQMDLRYQPPEFVAFTDATVVGALEHDPETTAQLAAAGLRGSLSVAVADLGEHVAANLHRLLGDAHELLRVPPASGAERAAAPSEADR